MVIGLKLAGLAAAALLATGGVSTTCSCQHETISCFDGKASFAAATCNEYGPIDGDMFGETLKCPPGETAISAGYRLDFGIGDGTPPMEDMSPTLFTGGNVAAYRFTWPVALGVLGAHDQFQVFHVYITCQH
jgi:hypothetical protein